MENKVSIDLQAAAITAINNTLNTLKQQLVFMVNLTADEKQALPKMGDKTLAFVEKAFDFGRQYPGLVPPFVSTEEMRKDLETAQKLRAISQTLTDLSTRAEDTLMLAGSEAYMASLAIYQNIKLSARNNVGGAKSAYDDLSARFPGRSAKKESK